MAMKGVQHMAGAFFEAELLGGPECCPRKRCVVLKWFTVSKLNFFRNVCRRGKLEGGVEPHLRGGKRWICMLIKYIGNGLALDLGS
jgi:hypothetical protein